MLSRRAAILGGIAASTSLSIAARAGTSSGSGSDGPPSTVLRLERRDIEINGKTASVFDIRQPDGVLGLVRDVGKPFRVRVENGLGEPSLIQLARADPAVAAGRRAGRLRASHSRRRQR